MSLAIDSWMSRSTENYIAVMAHYITTKLETVLSIASITQPRICKRDKLLHAIREWKLEGKIVAGHILSVQLWQNVQL